MTDEDPDPELEVIDGDREVTLKTALGEITLLPDRGSKNNIFVVAPDWDMERRYSDEVRQKLEDEETEE